MAMYHCSEDMKKGNALFEEGKFDEAQALFEDIIRRYPNNNEALNNLATIFYHQGCYQAAEQYFLKAYSIKEDDADVLSNLSDLYLHLKRWDDAALFLERYLRQVPDDCQAMNQLAFAYMESGLYGQAISLLERSLTMRTGQDDIRDILDTLKSATPAMASRTGKSAPPISVGLPVYNGGTLLAQAIESILAQDFGDFELIISDNCSTDQTQETCRYYANKDRRIRYYRLEENLGMAINFMKVIGHAEGQFFMWASHDDLREKTFMSACVLPLARDPSVALVYPHIKVLDANSNFLGVAEDRLAADQESPQERFTHLIWEIGMCNALYGLFRLSVVRKMSFLNKAGAFLFSDNLALAEIALFGKIIQIQEPLFIRRLTRNYNYHSYDERNTQLISEVNPKLFKEGITFPHSRLAYAHLELLNQSELSDADKDMLMKEVSVCFRQRFGPQMVYEIDRAVALINAGNFYHRWNQPDSVIIGNNGLNVLDHFHISGLLKRLREVMFFFPEREDVIGAYHHCLSAVLLNDRGK
jgi:glycosyltransferase involved in cell wall biosynthesis